MIIVLATPCLKILNKLVIGPELDYFERLCRADQQEEYW